MKKHTQKTISAWAVPTLTIVTSILMSVILLGARQRTGDLSTGLTQISTITDPEFEVATVKPSRSGIGGYPSINTHLRNLTVTNASVLDLIKWSYHLRAEQIKGGPPWMTDMKFDIVGQPDFAGKPTPEQHRLMMRKLLAERFHLAVHETQQVSSVYALSLLDGTLKMVLSNPQNGHNGISTKKLADSTTALQFSFTTIPDLLYVLMNSIQDRPVVDETGLRGEYDFTLIVPTAALEGNADPEDLTAALFKAVRSIGLQLRPKKAPVNITLIDRVAKPNPD